MWKCRFIVIEGDYSGTTLYATLPGFMISALASALGMPKQQDDDGKGYYDVDPIDVEGQTVLAYIAEDEYQGRLNNKVNQFFKPVPDAPKSDGRGAPGDSGGKGARLPDGRPASIPGVPRGSTLAPATQPAMPDDDIPF